MMHFSCGLHVNGAQSFYCCVNVTHFFWVMQDAVLILDLASNNHASSFWMVHRQRKRFVLPKFFLFGRNMCVFLCLEWKYVCKNIC